MISRTTKIGYEWKRVGLEKEELNEVLGKLLEHNYNELNRISEYVTKKLIDKGISPSDVEMTIKMLAEKQLTRCYTVIANALDEKLHRMRDEKKKPLPKKVEKKVEKDIEEGLKEEPKPEGDSAIEEAFKKMEEEPEEGFDG